MKHLLRCIATVLLAGLLAMAAACTGDTSDTPDTQAESETALVTDAETAGEPLPETAADTQPETAPITEFETAPVTIPETEPAPEEETMAPKTTIPVITDGKTDYTIVASTAIAEAVADDLAYMTRIMDERFGAHPAVAETAEGKQIELAYTNGTAPDWSIRIDEANGNISIQSGGTEGLSRAIQYFITQFLSVPKGDLSVDVNGGCTYNYENDRIDNSHFLSYEGGEKTVLAPSDAEGKLMTPAWLDTAVMVELRVDIADIGGTFAESYDLIDFYAETGVNVLWLSPIYERLGGNGYGNAGPHTIEPALTGKENPEEGWQVLSDFVAYAHSKGIYIFYDIITWGTVYESPLYTAHPDWYNGEAWGGGAYNWSHAELREWFITAACNLIERTGADGFRCDCEPFTSGYEIFGEVRKRLNQKGIYPVVMSEEGGRRDGTYDCEQDGVIKYGAMSRGDLYQNPTNFFVDGHLNIVRSTQMGIGIGGQDQQTDRKIMGTYRYYTNCITNHDYQARNVLGNRLKIGYAAIYAPYIPLWFMGDEFGQDGTGVLYFQPVSYDVIGEVAWQTYFYEDVKEMIAIRRSYPDLFEEWPLNHRESNIVEVEAEGLSKLQNYARYGEDRMIIVLANNEPENDGVCTVKIPFDALTAEGKAGDNYRVTDLLTGRVVTVGFTETVNNFTAIVPYEYCGVYLVERISE